MRTSLFMLLLSLGAKGLHAQGDAHEGEVWLGYIGSIRVADKWSVWQDYHLVPESFAVARYGLTYKLTPRVQMTGGLGFVWTSTAFTNDLVRREYRPWGQVVGQTRLGARLAGQLRFRYDSRHRQRIAEGSLLDEYGRYSRLRLMARLRWTLHTLPNGDLFHLSLMDEVLYDVGREVTNGLDQNRSYLLLGFTHEQYTLLGGYHVRMVPQDAGGMRYNHGLTLWFLHTIDIRHRFERSPDADVPVPHGG